MLSKGAHAPTKSIFMGILAGDDLRLSEVARVADGFRDAFGRDAAFQLGTVNDETTFSGRLVVATLVFEESAVAKATMKSRRTARAATKSRKISESALDAPDRFQAHGWSSSLRSLRDSGITTRYATSINGKETGCNPYFTEF